VPTTTIDEVADGIYRIHTPVELPIGGFSFNQYLVKDDDPLLFHTGQRKMFPLVRDAIARVMPLEKLRWISFSHVEADESGSLNDFLAAAPKAEPLCGKIAALVQVSDLADRAPRALAHGEKVKLGKHEVTWLDAPHVPHSWDCGFLFESKTKTLLCGDLFTQPGAVHKPVVETDILGPSEGMRKAMEYYAHSKDTRTILERLAATGPSTLACMHGSAWRGDGGKLIRALADSLGV
jgi:flavorubredoxin